MRVLVYEHLTAGAVPDAPAHLLRQGGAMIRALLTDLRALPHVEAVVMPPVAAGGDAYATFDRALMAVDAVWPIAPETQGCLERLSRLVLMRGRLLLNSLPEALRVAGSKLATWQVLRVAGVPAIPTWARREHLPTDIDAVVAKPDDGAGCEDTYVLQSGTPWPALPANTVYQPYMQGAPRSFCMLCNDSTAELIAINTQHVSRQGDRLRFEGVEACDDAPGREILKEIARRIHAAVPGLRGFVGVDYLDTDSGPVVVEINPRLTTAYSGLSARLGFNVAARVLCELEVLQP